MFEQHGSRRWSPWHLVGIVVWVLLTSAEPGASTLADEGRTLFVAPTGSGGSCAQGAPCSLNEALSQAAEGDLLYVAGGVYTGSGDAVMQISRPLTIHGGWDGALGTPPTLDPEMVTTVLDGENSRRVVEVVGASPALDGLTITRGLVVNEDGAGVYVGGGAPVLSRCVITGNRVLTGAGGGIALIGSSAHITGCVVASNQTHAEGSPWENSRGGGVFVNEGSPVIEHSTIQGNTSFWGGGLMVNRADATIRHTRILSNTAVDSGGGGLLSGDSSRVLDCEVAGNTAVYGGAGLYLYTSSTARVEANRIHHNVSDLYGGGICSRIGTEDTIVNNVIAHNGGPGGAGIYLYNTRSRVINNTIVDNNHSRPGIGIEADCQSGDPTIQNNVIMGHTYGVYFGKAGTLTFELDYNDVWASSEANYWHVTPGEHSLSADPLLVDPTTGDYGLRYGSPCLNAGVTVTDITRDIEGDPRPLGSAFEIGADEAEPLPEPTIPTLVPPTVGPEPTLPSETSTPTHSPSATPTSTPTGIPTITTTPIPRLSPTPMLPGRLVLPLVFS